VLIYFGLLGGLSWGEEKAPSGLFRELAQASSRAAPKSPALATLVKAAEGERELSIVLGGMGPQAMWDELGKLAKAKYGINVSFTYTSGPNLSQASSRLMQEAKAGQPSSSDGLILSSRLAMAAAEANAVERINWRELDPNIPQDIINRETGGLVIGGTNGGILYNTNLVKREDVPQSVDDLVNPKYKGKMISTSVASQWSELAILEGEEKVTKIITEIVKNGNVVGVLPGCGEVDVVASGQYAMQVFFCNMFQVQDYAKRTGAPVAGEFFKTSRWVTPYDWVVPKISRRPNLAKLTGILLATPEAQKILHEGRQISSPYLPGSALHEFVQESRKPGVKLLIVTPELEKKYERLWTGEVRRNWQRILRGASPR
jgi:iron(III) transport system substrate-binding protein